MRIHRPHRPGASRALAVAVVLAAALAGAAPAAARTAGASVQQDARPAASGLLPVSLPGLAARSYTVTLITGDQIALTAAGGGRYAVSARPAAGPSTSISVAARGGPAGTSALTATPAAAQALVSSGALDRNMFDVRFLAAHGDTGAAARLPVTVQFAGQQTAATLASKAAALPGAAVAATHPAAGTVDLTVTAAKAGAFWAALTGQRSGPGQFALGRPGARLAGGAVRAWLTGDEAAAAPPQPADDPVYRVNELITRRPGGEGCGIGTTLCVFAPTLTLTEVTGPGGGDVFSPDSVSCINASPCSTYLASYLVPAGIYSADGFAFFYRGQLQQWVDLLSPQVTVAGDTSFTVNTNAARQVTMSTPRPTQTFDGGVLGDFRGAADGSWTSNTLINTGIPGHLWAMPTAPVNTGTFHLVEQLILGKPLLTMTVTAPRQLRLAALYFTFSEAATDGSEGAVRFAGQRTLQLVDAGYGRPQDFAKINARGKLAFMRIDLGAGGCTPGSGGVVLDSQLTDALKAGAAGVLVDAADPAGTPHGWCALPVRPQYQGEQTPPIRIPMAMVPAAQGRTLASLAKRGPVRVKIGSYLGNSPYVYLPQIYREGNVPASLHTSLTLGQLSAVTDRFSTSKAGPLDECPLAFRPNEFVVEGICYGDIAAPARFTEYSGPRSPDTVYLREDLIAPTGQLFYNVVTQPGGTEDWGALPSAPGAPVLSSGVLQGQPGKWDNSANEMSACVLCRQGSTFYPVTDLTSGADPRLSRGLFGYAPGSIHLFRGSHQITPFTVLGGIAAYHLPAGRARYRLVTDGADMPTTWTFTSARPTVNTAPAGAGCVGTFLGSPGLCAADPLILLRYDAHTSLRNELPAPGRHRLDVTAYSEDQALPAITSLSVSVSTDGGTSWHALRLTRLGNGRYTALYSLPALASTSGSLSIRAQAKDAAGDTVSQTLLKAVRLIAPAASH